MTWFRIKKFIRFYLLAIIAALLMVSLTLLIFWETNRRAAERNRSLFDIRVENAQAVIEKRMNDYIQILKGAQALLKVSDTVSRQEWKDYIMLLNVDENYPGIQGIGYTVFVPKDSIPELERRVQDSGYPDFHVWPVGERDAYTSILYLEPFNLRNRRAFGYDMFSDSIRRQAMIKARDTGRPALTGKVQLVQETNVGVQNGFLLYLPVYKKGVVPLTVEERQTSIIGYAYSPFRMDDLMDGVLNRENEEYDQLDIKIYDGEVITPASLLYNKDNTSGTNNINSKLYRHGTLNIGEHSWQIVITAYDNFGYGRDFPWYILAGGLLTSILIFFILYSIANIRRSTYLNEVITDNATAALFILNTRDNCTFMNPAAEILTGYTFDELRQDTLHNMVHHSREDGTRYPAEECRIIQTLYSKGALINYEDVFFRKNGQSIHVSINARPVYENGKIVSYLLEVRDITQEKESEKTLMEKNKNLQTLNNIGKNLSAELGLKKLLQTVTDSCTELTGARFGAFFYNQVNEKGDSYMLYTLSGANPKDFAHFPSIRNTPVFAPTFNGEEIVRSDDITLDPRFGQNTPFKGLSNGHLKVKSYLAVPVMSGSGEVFGGLLFGHPERAVFDQHAEDMAKSIASQAAIAIDNSRLFEAISNKNKELTLINNELDNFVYTASHDLKAPVLNIEGLVYALNKAIEGGNTQKVPQIIELIRVSVLKFKDTIQALTDVARTNKNLDDEAEKIDLQELLKDICFSIQDMLDEANVQFRLELDCDMIVFSRSNMRSVLLNLITNAVKYRSENRQPQIHIHCRQEHTETVLIVADNGLGIPENQLPKIFKMFKRYHTHVEGTGIGLYLVKRIIENSGGTIAISSRPDEGTRFELRIPLQHAEVAH